MTLPRAMIHDCIHRAGIAVQFTSCTIDSTRRSLEFHKINQFAARFGHGLFVRCAFGRWNDPLAALRFVGETEAPVCIFEDVWNVCSGMGLPHRKSFCCAI